MTMRWKWVWVIAAFALGIPLTGVVSAEDVIARFDGDGRVQYRLVVAATVMTNGRGMRLSLPNNDEKQSKYDPKTDLLAIVTSLKRGDYFKATYAVQNNTAMVSALSVYAMKPGEELLNGFVFNESYDKKEGKLNYQMVDVKKFDQVITFVIPNKKDPASGDMAPDPELLADAGKFKAGDVVLIDAIPGRPHPQIKSIELYTAPQPGYFIKSSEQKDGAGQSVTAAEIEADGKTITALVPGHLDGKKWVTDLKVLNEVKRLRPKSDVMFRASDENGKTWLRAIAMAPKQINHVSGPETKPAADKPEKPAKPDKKPAAAGK